MGCSSSKKERKNQQDAVDDDESTSITVFNESSGGGGARGEGRAELEVVEVKSDLEPAALPAAAAQEKKAPAPKNNKNLSRYQQLQQEAYAHTFQMEVVTAEQRVDDLKYRQDPAGKKSREEQIEKMEKYAEKREATGYAHSVLDLNYQQLTERLIKTQNRMAELENKKRRKQ